MALDVVLSKTAEDLPCLRFYRWEPYCLSLGYAQKFDEFSEIKCREEQIEVVRRPTGGRAILHAEEVTYSVTLSEKNELFHLSILEFYKYFSGGLARGLKNLGIPVTIEKTGIQRKQGKNHPAPLCFSSVGRYELKVNGKKIVGSAQRRFPGSLLQHGSILLGDYHLKQESLLEGAIRPQRALLKRYTTDAGAELERPVNYEEMVSALRTGIKEELGITLIPYELKEAQIDEALHIAHEYSVLELKEFNAASEGCKVK